MSDMRLIEAVKNDDYSAAETLIGQGADVNQQDEQGWTPLNFAAGKGNISLVKLLVKNGADIFKVGRDLRTPYLIALAAGRVSVAKYLREVENSLQVVKPVRQPRKYCKIYYEKDLRAFAGWSESRINRKEKKENGSAEVGEGFTDENVVFIHQDLTVTESAWHNENVIFDNIDSAWKEFCANSLNFEVPDDLDLIISHEENG